MKGAWWIILGGLMVVVLMAGIGAVYFDIKVPVKQVKKSYGVIPNLSTDYSSPGGYSEIMVNDIIDGKVLRLEMDRVEPFAADTLPLKYIRTENRSGTTLKLDEADFARIKADMRRSPFRNKYYYKIRIDDEWLVVVGQQVRNADGSSAFLHFALRKESEVKGWGKSDFGVQPLASVRNDYFDDFVPKSFLSEDPHYYEAGGKVDLLMKEWLETGTVPEELQRTVLLMSIKW